MVLVVLQQDHLALELCLELVSRTGPGHECLFCYLPNSPCLLTLSPTLMRPKASVLSPGSILLSPAQNLPPPIF